MRWDVGLWVWCLNQDAIVPVDGERVSSTKNSAEESLKDQSVVGCIFWFERIIDHEFVLRGQTEKKHLYREVL